MDASPDRNPNRPNQVEVSCGHVLRRGQARRRGGALGLAAPPASARPRLPLSPGPRAHLEIVSAPSIFLDRCLITVLFACYLLTDLRR